MLEVDIPSQDTFSDEMIVQLNVLSPAVEDGVLRNLDAAEVIAVYCHRLRHLHLQILK